MDHRLRIKPRMTRSLAILCVLLLPGCAVQDSHGSLADTFGSTATTATTGDTTTGAAGEGASSEAASGSQSDGTVSASGGRDEAGAGTGTGEEASEGGESTSSGEPGAVCGDGVVEGDEECDDANMIEGDGCLSNCTREWFVFLTSDPATQGDFGGVVKADYHCRHRATLLFLPNGERYKAWISTSEVQPVDRLYHARGPYKLINGVRVAANWEALVAGPLENPINVTELSETSEGLVVSGTLPSGERVPNSTHCNDWTSNDGEDFGWFGVSTEVSSDWAHALEQPCAVGASFVCFEQP